MFSQMGGEGITWVGLSNFTDTPHVFQNLGDGTYYHSGLMAIRAAVAANTNITYKILYNDAVSMTGGQPVDGPLSVGDVTHQVIHEGVRRCVVVSDTPEAYGAASGLASGVEVYHRDDLEQVQLELREHKGCTVLIYEQTCAAEKRRRRKRGSFPDPQKRAFINDAVCEGCGDCSVQANCVSIMPKETELGRKRAIDQSSCNKDFSCVKGFCPSFVTVHGGQPRKPKKAELDDRIFDSLPPVTPLSLQESNYAVMVSGIGGTGVVTVTAVLGMAAHLEGRASSIYDMTGMAQKNGAVLSHLRIAESQHQLKAARLGVGDADLVLGFDIVAALSKDAFQTLEQGKTRFIGNSRVTPTASFQSQPDVSLEEKRLERQVIDVLGQDAVHFLDATGIGLALMGDSIATNMFMVGYAYQNGSLPVGAEAIERAIELNGVAIPFNIRAFRLGRLWAWQPEALTPYLNTMAVVDSFQPETDLDAIVAHRIQLLTDYQDASYAKRYEALVTKVRQAEWDLKESSLQ